MRDECRIFFVFFLRRIGLIMLKEDSFYNTIHRGYAVSRDCYCHGVFHIQIKIDRET